ncbi:MAG TPA: type II toxin-antitoxin system PemK/MazF family toxin [Promineifilum sp.]|nr:type II toxin-antitoxin system PemK/MazF family toxin [Promineifilum sp.]
MPKASVVVVTQLYTVDKRDLIEKIGVVSASQVRQILQGLGEVLTP